MSIRRSMGGHGEEHGRGTRGHGEGHGESEEVNEGETLTSGVPWWVCPGGCALVGVPWWVCPGGCALVGVPWWVCPGGCVLQSNAYRLFFSNNPIHLNHVGM